VLVGRLENLVSDRRLVAPCALRLDILLFLGYEGDEDLPWHSTLSRTRQLFPAAVFERLFDHVLAQCVPWGLVAGDTQAVDSAPVKAHASLDSLREKPALAATAPLLAPTGQDHTAASVPVVTAPAHPLRREAARQAKRRTEPGPLGAHHEKARLLSNKTPYSPTDPDARISLKPGKARALNYRCPLAVDTARGVISHVQADDADSRDSLPLPRLLTGLQRRLRAHQPRLRDLLADAGYANGANYALLEAEQVTAWMPVLGQYKAEIEGFPYDAQQDVYHCRAGKVLPFQRCDVTADGSWVKLYRAAYRDGQQCPLKPTCVPGAKRKQLTKTVYDAAYYRAWQRQQRRCGQRHRCIPAAPLRPPPDERAGSGQCAQNKATDGRGLHPEKAAQAPAPAATEPGYGPAKARLGGYYSLSRAQSPECRATVGPCTVHLRYCSQLSQVLQQPRYLLYTPVARP